MVYNHSISEITQEGIRVIPIEEIISLVTQSNYILILDYALLSGRTDIIDTLIQRYTPELLSLSDVYNDLIHGKYEIVPRNTIEYLYQSRYIVLSDFITAIIMDDSSFIPDNYSLDRQDIQHILYFDAIHIWKKIEKNISLSSNRSLLHLAHGKIHLSLMSSQLSDDILTHLIPNTTEEEMYYILQIPDISESLRIQCLTLAARRGYLDILYNYMKSKDIFLIISHPSVKEYIEEICHLFDEMYPDTFIGTQILSILNKKDYQHVSERVWISYLYACIINANIDGIQNIKSIYSLSERVKDKAYLLIQQYHLLDNTKYKQLIEVIE